MSISVEISIGEFLDKLSILKIKLEKISDQKKKQNIKQEHDLYIELLKQVEYPGEQIRDVLEKLLEVNLALWEIEDAIRAKEKDNIFDEEFIQLARSVYKNNDRRAQIKRQANLQFQSKLVEEKSYQNYSSEENQ